MTATTTMTVRAIKAKTDTQTPMMILCSVVNPELSGSWGAAVVSVIFCFVGANKEYVILFIIHFLSLAYCACLSLSSLGPTANVA